VAFVKEARVLFLHVTEKRLVLVEHWAYRHSIAVAAAVSSTYAGWSY